MVSISQTQIALYLHDYTSLMSLMLSYPNKQPFALFQEHLLKSNRAEQATEEYYQRMLNIAYIFTKMKLFSISEDYTLKQQNNFINNDDLDLSFLDSKITGNRSSISNKKLLQMLRDGFNHTTEGNELYKISPNCKYIEFSFKQPTPIKIKLSLDDIASLTSAIGEAAQTFQFFSFNQPTATTIKEYIENLHLTRHYFPEKIEPSIMNSVFKLQNENNHNAAVEVAKTINKASEKEISLSQTQINSILKNIEIIIESGIITLDEFKENLSDLTIILLNKELPIPILKLDNYLLDSYAIGMLLPHKAFSYNQMYNIFTQGLTAKTPNPMTKYKDIFDRYKQLVFKTYFPNAQEKQTYASLLFTEYILSNFKPDDEFIRIGNRTVEYKKLRNSLVHGRWHIEKNKIVFCDAKPNIKSETDYNWSVKLDSTALNNYCTNILQTKLQDEKPKQKQKSILEI